MMSIESEFKQRVINTFGNNIEFAFIFGSMARGTFKMQKSDIDTFICLKAYDLQKINDFKKWIIGLQYKFNLKPDLEYPSEIVTYQSLESIAEDLGDVSISLSCNGSETFDKIFWACILSSFYKKQAFIGGKEGRKKLSNIITKCKPYPKKWGEQFIELLSQKKEVPIFLQTHYPGLNKQAIEQELTKLFKARKYSEIIRLIEFITTKDSCLLRQGCIDLL